MKKLFCILFVITLIFASASAEIDLSGMSLDELVALKDQINLAMWKCEEWQEVTVPEGVWLVGYEIPEGHWTVKVPSSSMFSHIKYCTSLDNTGKDFAPFSLLGSALVYAEDYMFFDKDAIDEYSFVVRDGQYIILSAPVIFTPYTGKPSFTFK